MVVILMKLYRFLGYLSFGVRRLVESMRMIGMMIVW